jgi:hypothetical protein
MFEGIKQIFLKNSMSFKHLNSASKCLKITLLKKFPKKLKLSGISHLRVGGGGLIPIPVPPLAETLMNE